MLKKCVIETIKIKIHKISAETKQKKKIYIKGNNQKKKRKQILANCRFRNASADQ